MPKYKNYTQLPNKHQWKLDLKLKGTIYGHKKSPFPALERIGRLLDEFDQTTDLPSTSGLVPSLGVKLVILFEIYRHVAWLAKVSEKNNFTKQKLGGVLSDDQLGAVQGLRDFTRNQIKLSLGSTDGTLDQDMVAFFGKSVNDSGRDEDAGALRNNLMHYYRTDAMRAPFKLSFRNGLAHKWSLDEGGRKGSLSIYDTAAAGDDIEFGGSLYVMDQRGRLYVSGKEDPGMMLKHSSFMAGLDVLAAGTIRVDDGQIVWISGRSGHYKPTVLQIVHVLERLRSYQINLSGVTVFRENYTRQVTGLPSKYFEPCDAEELMIKRAWPTGEGPQLMRIG